MLQRVIYMQRLQEHCCLIFLSEPYPTSISVCSCSWATSVCLSRDGIVVALLSSSHSRSLSPGKSPASLGKCCSLSALFFLSLFVSFCAFGFSQLFPLLHSSSDASSGSAELHGSPGTSDSGSPDSRDWLVARPMYACISSDYPQWQCDSSSSSLIHLLRILLTGCVVAAMWCTWAAIYGKVEAWIQPVRIVPLVSLGPVL
jgi:hypothetical protein